jgi:hypothetical protein
MPGLASWRFKALNYPELPKIKTSSPAEAQGRWEKLKTIKAFPAFRISSAPLHL